MADDFEEGAGAPDVGEEGGSGWEPGRWKTPPQDTDGPEDDGGGEEMEGGEEPAQITGPQLRIRQRRTRRELEGLVAEQNARLEEQSVFLREIHEAATKPREAAPQTDDEIYQNDPRAWYEKKLADEMAEMKEYVREQRRREALSDQEREREWQQRQMVEQVTQDIRTDVGEYEQTDFGQGFSDRMTYWYEKLNHSFQRAGYAPQEAHRLASAEIAATKRLGQRYENEYAFMDMLFREKYGLPPAEAEADPEQNGHRQPAPRRAPADSGRVAAGRSGLAGSIGQPGPTSRQPTTGLGTAPGVNDVRAALAKAPPGTAVWDLIARRGAKTR